ncbi:MAG: hypothetical protein E6Q83_00860 [Thiothrix sp.]|nr:MAG: hypothetical protein E6Q83_00860 [Thiothrix sp.]
MAENTERTKELTSTQEGIIAGLVLLFFGLLYWYLNPWHSEPTSEPMLAEQTSNRMMQANSLGLANTSDTQMPVATEVTTNTTQTQTSTTNHVTPAIATTTQTNTTTQTIMPSAAALAATPPATGAVPPPPGPITAPQPETVTSNTSPGTEVSQATTETATTTTNTGTTEAANMAENTASSQSAATNASTAQVTETTAVKTNEASTISTATTETTKPVETSMANPAATATTADSAAKPANTTAQTSPTTETPTTTATTASTNPANKLELAPGSPEAKLQSYLEKKTLETPVGMDKISFEAKTAKLTKESEASVLMLAALLAQYPEANFLITSYTTETSTENKNSDELSLMRAQTLGEQLVKAGIDAKRITIMGMGKRPSPDNTSVSANKSQRIEISVIQ